MVSGYRFNIRPDARRHSVLFKSKVPCFAIALGALLLTGSLAAEAPPSDDGNVSAPAPSTASASSTIAWDAEQKVFRAPADHESQRIAAELRTILAGKSLFSSSNSYEKETLGNGVVRMRVGVDGLNLMSVSRTGDQQLVAACVQGSSLDETHRHDASAQIHVEHEAAPTVRPKSLPATEGWVEQ